MWPDNETANDLIGFQVHADLIRRVITNPLMLPTTIGIFGDWGGGKTSIMKMLERGLDPKSWPEGSSEQKSLESVAVVYVNTWQFEGYEDAKTAIISAVLQELSEHKQFGPKVRDASVKLLKKVNWMRFAHLTLKHVALPATAAFLTGGAAAIPSAIAAASGFFGSMDKEDKEASPEPTAEVSGLIRDDDEARGETDIRRFREEFTQMLKDGGISTLAVLVDDLDRCTPERIIENLEAVKLFLSAEQTAFIIGADRRIVEHAIRHKYAQRSIELNERDKEEQLVRDYLEKLVQIPYSLPRLSAAEIQTYMTLLFCQRHMESDQFGMCLASCNTARARNRYQSFGYADVKKALSNAALKSDLEEALAFTSLSAPLIADGLKGNPRQVKRFLNAFLLRKELAVAAKLENIRDAILVKLMILEYADAELFTKLFFWQSQQNGHPQELAELENLLAKDEAYREAAGKFNIKWDSPQIRRWVAMEPRLKDVDLRDYFWVARDRLESTFTGIAMIPPAVRQVLDGLISGVAPKRNAAITTAKSLTPEEKAALIQALDQKIMRQPEDAAGYEGLKYLIDAGIAEALTQFIEILTKRPLEKVPAAVGMQTANLYNSRPGDRILLKPVCELLNKSQSFAGKAYKQSAGMKRH